MTSDTPPSKAPVEFGTAIAQAASDSSFDSHPRGYISPGRVRRLTPRFSDEELRDIEQAAASIAMTPTGFCAQSAIAAARGVPLALASAQQREDLARLQRQLFAARTEVARFGTNVNQAVRVLNSTGHAPEWMAKAMAMVGRSLLRLDEVISDVDRRLR